jgi:hypothetical protein
MNEPIYTFEGQDRLAFDFLRNSPTPTGLFLLFGACLFLTLSKITWGKKRNHVWIASLVCYGSCVVGVAMTYSRGAMCALFCVLVMCGTLLRRHEHRWFYIVVVMTVVLLCAVPNGHKRLLSSMELHTDQSIANRLLLWEGVCRSIVHRFPNAVSKDGLGIEYQKYWQPFEQKHSYSTAVNLWLTIYSCNGFYTFIFITWGYFVIIYSTWRNARKTSHVTALVACFLLIAFGVNNIFSTITDIVIIIIILISVLAYFIMAKPMKYDKIDDYKIIRYLLLPFVAALIVSFIPFVLVFTKPSKFYVKCETLYFNETAVTFEWFGTKATQSKGLLLFWMGAADVEEEIFACRLARAACLQGLDALLIPNVANETIILDYCLKKYKNDCDIYHAGIGMGAARALEKTIKAVQDNREIKGLVLACPEGQSPFIPKIASRDIKIPVVFLCEDENPNLDYEFLSALKLFTNTTILNKADVNKEEYLIVNLLSFHINLAK